MIHVMQTAVYLRMSLDRTGEQLGIERQREDCAKLVAQRGWTLAETYVDNSVSATSTRRRPAYEDMLAAVQSGRYGAIVAWSLDRLTRRVADLERLAEVCDRAGVTVALVRGSDLDLSTPSGRLVARLLGSVARHEVEVKSDRQRREAQQRAQRGAPPGGRRAFGYTSDGASVVEAEAGAVRGAFASLLAGAALSTIATDLNAAGFTTTMGGPWKHNAIGNLLRNPRYAAIRTHRGIEVGPAAWPAIIDEGTHRAAMEILTGPNRRTNHVGSERKWLGGGLYRCGRDGCSTTMVCTYREKYDDGRARRIYRCPSCLLSRLAEPVDEIVNDVIEARLGLPDVALLLTRPDDDGSGRLVELRTRRRSLARLMVDGILTEDEVREEAARLDAMIGAAEGRIVSGDESRAAAAILGAPNPVAAWRDADPQTQHDVLGVLVTVTLLPVPSGRRVFDPESVGIEWRVS